MRTPALPPLFLAALLALGAVAPAAAREELAASGTRLAIGGGAPRFYMTYGHAEDTELFAPIIPELARLEIVFKREGDEYAIYYKGERRGRTWPIIRTRDGAPEADDEPFVLLLGGSVFVPVRKIAELYPVSVRWSRRDNLVTLAPDLKRPARAVAAQPGRRTKPSPAVPRRSSKPPKQVAKVVPRPQATIPSSVAPPVDIVPQPLVPPPVAPPPVAPPPVSPPPVTPPTPPVASGNPTSAPDGLPSGTIRTRGSLANGSVKPPKSAPSGTIRRPVATRPNPPGPPRRTASAYVPPAQTGGLRPPATALLGGNVITGVEMRREAGRLKLTVRTSNGVAPTTLHLKSPPRIALDFPGARWEEGLTLPSGVGEVTRLRNGYFQPPANPDAVAARLVLELKTPLTKIVELRMAETNVIASVGRGGPQMAKGMIPRTGAQRVQVGVQRRGKPRQMASRGGLNGSFNTDDPGQVTRILSPRLGNALAGKIICVDAGHGGHSKGAAGLQHLEKDICLKISRELQQELEARGARVVMTRSDDTFVSLAGRCQIANGAEADAFISIHLNSSPRRNSATGTETFWYTSHSFPLAQALHARMVGTVGKLDRGVRHRRLYVCRAVTMPSVLLEVAFINNENDEQLLASSQLHQNLAVSLAEGVVDFFRQR